MPKTTSIHTLHEDELNVDYVSVKLYNFQYKTKGKLSDLWWVKYS